MNRPEEYQTVVRVPKLTQKRQEIMLRKERFVAAVRMFEGNIPPAAKFIGEHLTQVRRWMKSDVIFRYKVTRARRFNSPMKEILEELGVGRRGSLAKGEKSAEDILGGTWQQLATYFSDIEDFGTEWYLGKYSEEHTPNKYNLKRVEL